MSEKPQQKTCTYCKKTIPYKALKCPECHTDLRTWFGRHPFITTLLILFIGIPVALSALFSALPTPTANNVSPIGKEAYNATNGARIGKILEEVDCTNTPNTRCYKIDQGPNYSRPTEWPVDQTKAAE